MPVDEPQRSEGDAVAEHDLREALRPRRPDPETFLAGVEGKLRTSESRQSSSAARFSIVSFSSTFNG